MIFNLLFLCRERSERTSGDARSERHRGAAVAGAELPNATVSVRVVRERMGNNVAGQDVALLVGGSRRTAKTDQQGRAQFDGLPPGTVVQATTTVDGEELISQQFSVPGTGGVRVALIAGIATAAAREKAAAEAAAKEPARPGVVEFGPESRVVIEIQDDVLTVFYLLDVVNNARTPIDIGGPLADRAAHRRGRRLDHARFVA